MFFGLIRSKQAGYYKLEIEDDYGVKLLTFGGLKGKNKINFFGQYIDFFAEDDQSTYQNQVIAVAYASQKNQLAKFFQNIKCIFKNDGNSVLQDYSFSFGFKEEKKTKAIEESFTFDIFNNDLKDFQTSCVLLNDNYQIFTSSNIFENMLLLNILNLSKVEKDSVDIKYKSLDYDNFLSLQTSLCAFLLTYTIRENTYYLNCDFSYINSMELKINYNLGFDNEIISYVNLSSSLKCGIYLPFFDEILENIKLMSKNFYKTQFLKMDLQFIFENKSPIFIYPLQIPYLYLAFFEKLINKISYILNVPTINYKNNLIQASQLEQKDKEIIKTLLLSNSQQADFKRKIFAYNNLKIAKNALDKNVLKGIGHCFGFITSNFSKQYVEKDFFSVVVSIDSKQTYSVFIPIQNKVKKNIIKTIISENSKIPPENIFIKEIAYKKINYFINSINVLGQNIAEDIIQMKKDNQNFLQKDYFLNYDYEKSLNKSYVSFICEVESNNFLSNFSLKKSYCKIYCGHIEDLEYLKNVIRGKVEYAYSKIFQNFLYDGSILTQINKNILPIDLDIDFVNSNSKNMLSISGIENFFVSAIISALSMSSYQDINKLPFNI